MIFEYITGAPKLPCGDMVIMACHSDREHRTERTVPNAERINYIELKSGKNNPSCTFGVTYGFYGVKIWTKENCREKIKVYLTPSMSLFENRRLKNLIFFLLDSYIYGM